MMVSKEDRTPNQATALRKMYIYGSLTLICAILAWTISFAYDQVLLHLQIIIPFSFVMLGMLIKYGDESFDADCFDKRKVKALAVPCGIWMGLIILVDPNSATIFVGLLLALLVAAKYDNAAFKASFLVATVFALVSFIYFPDNMSYLGVLVVFVAAFADEKVNDMADQSKRQGLFWSVLRQRPILKVAILGLCVTGLLSSYLYFFAFLGFDFGYSLVENYARYRGCRSVPV
jgi:hypothetical protein